MLASWEKPNFLCPLGSLKILAFSELPAHTELSYLKPFYNILHHASAANIEEIMKFNNLSTEKQSFFFFTQFVFSCISVDMN